MSDDHAPGGLGLPAAVVEMLREMLPGLADSTVQAIIVEVPSYAGALVGEMADTIRTAVEVALGGFLTVASRPRSAAAEPPGQAIEGAYALGRGEARSGRSMDALLSAYRVGARVSWRELSGAAVSAGVDADTVSRFAELVFAYIDRLSAASAAGHADELATTGVVRERHRARLGEALLRGADEATLLDLAGRADWEPPPALHAVIVSAAHTRTVLALLDPRTLRLHVDESDPDEELAVLLVPDTLAGAGRGAVLRATSRLGATVGPVRPWSRVRESHQRALRVRTVVPPGSEAQDTESHLADVLLAADPAALRDLRAYALAPLDGETPASRERLEETLRWWLLHQGRRDAVAASLHVHPQTVRYRLGRLRELFGEALEEPDTVLALTMATARPALAAGLADPETP